MDNPEPLARASAIYQVLAHIPAGKVLSYGELAKRAGIPGAARLVGKVLRDLPEGSQLPWHRVVNAQGKLSLPQGSTSYCEQQQRLTSEGVEFVNQKINLAIYGYNA